jgi:CRP/FNR family cyclic AMP-dependent transcriptional regulator
MPRQRIQTPSILGLQCVQMLHGLAPATLERIAAECTWHRAAAGRRIISRDAPDRSVYLIVSGKVRVTAFSANGRQVTYRDIAAGGYFGELAALDGRARTADVDALEDVLLAALLPEKLWNLIREEPTIAERLLRQLAGSVRELTDRVFDLSTLGVQNRLHAELLRLAREAGVHDNAAVLDPAPKHPDVASRISTYREQVTREISALVKLGLVVRRGRALVIPDVARLEKLVEDMRNGG